MRAYAPLIDFEDGRPRVGRVYGYAPYDRSDIRADFAVALFMIDICIDICSVCDEMARPRLDEQEKEGQRFVLYLGAVRASGGPVVKVELTPEMARWVEAEVEAGAFSTPEESVRYALNEFRVNALRGTLDAAVAEGGSHAISDARRYVREQREKRNAPAASL